MSVVSFPVTIHLQAWLHLFCSFPLDVVAVRSPCSYLLQLTKSNFLNLSNLWLPTHCGRPLLASFQYVNVCHMLESPTWTRLSGLVSQVLNSGKNYFLRLPGYSLPITTGFQKCSDHRPKLSQNCQYTYWSKTITSSCFVYCRANLRARSLASDLQLKNLISVLLWTS